MTRLLAIPCGTLQRLCEMVHGGNERRRVTKWRTSRSGSDSLVLFCSRSCCRTRSRSITAAAAWVVRVATRADVLFALAALGTMSDERWMSRQDDEERRAMHLHLSCSTCLCMFDDSCESQSCVQTRLEIAAGTKRCKGTSIGHRSFSLVNEKGVQECAL